MYASKSDVPAGGTPLVVQTDSGVLLLAGQRSQSAREFAPRVRLRPRWQIPTLGLIFPHRRRFDGRPRSQPRLVMLPCESRSRRQSSIFALHSLCGLGRIYLMDEKEFQYPEPEPPKPRLPTIPPSERRSEGPRKDNRTPRDVKRKQRRNVRRSGRRG